MAIISVEQAEQALFSWLRNSNTLPATIEGTALDLGCGIRPKNPFLAQVAKGCDIRQEHPDVIECDLFKESIPFADESISAVTAFDFFEHVPRVDIRKKTRFPFVDLMSDIHRVMQRNGYLYSRTPAYPHPEAFKDPTHVNIITEKTFSEYFCGRSPLAAMYGFTGRFAIVNQCWHECYLLTLMQKK
jgi:SAM-dependent methyltransferase